MCSTHVGHVGTPVEGYTVHLNDRGTAVVYGHHQVWHVTPLQGEHSDGLYDWELVEGGGAIWNLPVELMEAVDNAFKGGEC